MCAGFQEEAGDRPLVPNIGIVITDGESLVDPELTIPIAAEAKRRGITTTTSERTHALDTSLVQSSQRVFLRPSLLFGVTNARLHACI